MPQESLEAYIESLSSDSLFRAELMATESVAERMELICAALLCYVLNKIEQEQLDIDEDNIEESEEGDLSGDSPKAPLIKGSSPQRVGYARPGKVIERRFKD